MDFYTMNNLMKLRMKAGLTIDELAQRTGVCSQTIRNWEDGEHHPHRNNFVRLTETLGRVSNGEAPRFVRR